MPKYRVEMEVTSSRRLRIEAPSKEEARRIAAAYERTPDITTSEFDCVADYGLFGSSLAGVPIVEEWTE